MQEVFPDENVRRGQVPAGGSPVTCSEAVVPPVESAEQPVRQRALGCYSDVVGAGGRKHLGLPAPIEEVVGDLVRNDRGLTAKELELGGAKVGNSDVPCFSGRKNLVEASYGVFPPRLSVG